MLLSPQNKLGAAATGARAKWLAGQVLNPSIPFTRQPRALCLPLPGALLESLKSPKNLPLSYAISAVLVSRYVCIAHFILDFSAHFRYHNGIVGVQQLTI
jgi:hypothetical protein